MRLLDGGMAGACGGILCSCSCNSNQTSSVRLAASRQTLSDRRICVQPAPCSISCTYRSSATPPFRLALSDWLRQHLVRWRHQQPFLLRWRRRACQTAPKMCQTEHLFQTSSVSTAGMCGGINSRCISSGSAEPVRTCHEFVRQSTSVP